MCEFKIVRKNDGTQIGEEVVVVGYSENNELLFSDIMSINLTLDSAVITNVNTLNQTLEIVEHPLIKDFVALIRGLGKKSATKEQVEVFQKKLETIKNEI